MGVRLVHYLGADELLYDVLDRDLGGDETVDIVSQEEGQGRAVFSTVQQCSAVFSLSAAAGHDAVQHRDMLEMVCAFMPRKSSTWFHQQAGAHCWGTVLQDGSRPRMQTARAELLSDAFRGRRSYQANGVARRSPLLVLTQLLVLCLLLRIHSQTQY